MRYTCELSFSEMEKKHNIIETRKRYEKLFEDLQSFQISPVNPASLTAYYHYCLLLYDIIEDRLSAIKILKAKYQEVINNLDIVYTKYQESYEIINIVADILTTWVIENNYGGINSLNS